MTQLKAGAPGTLARKKRSVFRKTGKAAVRGQCIVVI